MITFKELIATWKESKPLRAAIKSFNIVRLSPIESTVAKVFPRHVEPWMTKSRARPSETLLYPLVYQRVYEFEMIDNYTKVKLTMTQSAYVWITLQKDLVFEVDGMFYILNVFWAAEYLAAEGQSYERLLAVLRDDQEDLKRLDADDQLEAADRLMQLVNGG